MGTFVKKSCIGLVWDAAGVCRGVHVRRAGARCRVVRVWQSEPQADEPLSSRLGRAPAELDAGESTIIIAGSIEPTAGLVDLTLPALAPADLRNALAFELNRHAPIQPDRLVWGHRPLGDGRNGSRRLRLVYFRESDWDRWIQVVGGIPRGVDALLPPAAALDPVLADREVRLQGSSPASAFLFTPAGDGTREVRIADPNDQAGAPETALFGLPELDPGPLGAELPEVRREYAPAVILALYGLTRNAAADRRTWAPLPYDLRPRRNQASRILATALAFYLLAGIGVLVARQYSRGMERLGALRTRTAALQKQLAALQAPKTDDKLFDAVRKDLEDALIDRPTLTETLVELTRLIDKSAWVTSLTWTDGKIDLQVRTAEDNPDIFEKLRESPIFQDVVPLGSTVDHRTNETTLRFQLRATFRLPPTGPAVSRPPASPTSPRPPKTSPGVKPVKPPAMPAASPPKKTSMQQPAAAHAFPGKKGRVVRRPPSVRPPAGAAGKGN